MRHSALIPQIETVEGPIPAIQYGRYWFVCQTTVTRKIDSHGSVRPLRDCDGRIVYAVPGGGKYIP